MGGRALRPRLRAALMPSAFAIVLWSVIDASRYITLVNVCKLSPLSRVRHLYRRPNITKRLVQLGGAQASGEKAVPDRRESLICIVLILTLDDETTISRCAVPSGRIRVISGSLTLSSARSWTSATHMLTAGPTSLPIPAWQFHFRIRIRIRTVIQ